MVRIASPTPPAPITPPAQRVPVEYVSKREAAAFYGVSVATLDNWRRAQHGPPEVRISARRVVFPLAGLREHAEKLILAKTNPTAA